MITHFTRKVFEVGGIGRVAKDGPVLPGDMVWLDWCDERGEHCVSYIVPEDAKETLTLFAGCGACHARHAICLEEHVPIEMCSKNPLSQGTRPWPRI